MMLPRLFTPDQPFNGPLFGGADWPVRLLRKRRTFAWSALALLLLAVVGLQLSQASVTQSREALAAAQTSLREAEQTEIETTQQVERSRLAQSLLRDAKAAGLSYREWDERRFNMKQVVMTRESVNALMQELARSSVRLFAAERFELSVKGAEDGLFSPPTQVDSELAVSLRGSMVFRTVEALP